MTDVYIDGIKLDFEDTAGDSTLGNLILEVEKELKGIRRYVNLLSIDGESIEDWRAGAVLKKAIHASAEVKLQTASFDEVALEGLDTLREYAAVIKENISSCVSSLRRGSPAGDGFSSVVEGVVEVIKTVEGLLRGGMYGVELFRKDPGGCCAAMIEVLESLKEAGQARDCVTMADILEYELAPLVKELEETLRLPEA